MQLNHAKILRALPIVFTIFTLLTLQPQSASAQPIQIITIYVDGDNGLAVPGGSQPGDSWQNSFKYLQDALARAQQLLIDPDLEVHLWVAATATNNPYRPDRSAVNPNGTGDRAATFTMLNRCRWYGGFVGGETVLTQRDPEANPTVLSGDLLLNDQFVVNPPFSGDWSIAGNQENSLHVVTCPVGINSTALLNGFQIRGGHANGPGLGEAFGGGLSISGGSTPRVVRCMFVMNSTSWEGTGGGGGGAVAVLGTSHLNPARPLFVNCVFVANRAFQGGGVYRRGSGGLQLHNCLFFKNRANVGAGYCSITMNLPIPSPPSAYSDFLNCTLTRNEATGFQSLGGGIFADLDSTPLRVANSIFWRNTDSTPFVSVAQIVIGSSAQFILENNCIQDDGEPDGVVFMLIGLAPLSNTDRDPLFCQPGFDQFGSDLFEIHWSANGPLWGSFGLSEASQCIDTGSITFLPNDFGDVDDDGQASTQLLPRDLHLKTRQFNAAGGGPTIVDRGVYEFPTIYGCSGDLNGSCAVDGLDLGILLASWGQCSGVRPCSADLNCDGQVNGLDLGILFAQWGSCHGCGESQQGGESMMLAGSSINDGPELPFDPSLTTWSLDDLWAWYLEWLGSGDAAEE